MDLFKKREPIDRYAEVDRLDNKTKAKKIDGIYKVGACVLALLWVMSFFKPFSLNFNIKSLMNIKYIFNEKRGNTIGNDLNKGAVVNKGSYTYYVNFEDDNKIYRVKDGSSTREKFCEDKASFLNIVGNDLYYVNESDENKIYKLNLKSNEKTKIIDERAAIMQISGGRIYYLKMPGYLNRPLSSQYRGGIMKEEGEFNIFSTKLNGENKKKVLNEMCGMFAVYNGYIYYLDTGFGGKLYRITKDGKDKVKLSTNQTYRFWMDDKFIYYLNDFSSDGKPSITRIKHDGSGEAKISESYINTMNIIGDTIYFSSDSGVSKMNRDGKDIMSVLPSSNGGVGYITISRDWIYCGSEYQGLYRIKTSGRDKEPEPEVSKRLFAEGIKGDIDNSHGISLNTYSYNPLYRKDDYIYYSGYGKLSRFKFDGSEVQVLIDNFNASQIDISSGYIFYINYEDFNKIYMIREDGTGNKIFFNEKVTDFKIIGDYLYYRRLKDSGRGIYRIKLDGSENTRILDEYINTAIIHKDNIYYSDSYAAIKKCDLDGKNSVTVIDRSGDRFLIEGDYIYYVFGGIHRMNLKTNEDKQIYSGEGSPLWVDNDYIYITSFTERAIYKLRSDGSTKIKLLDDPNQAALPAGKYLYFISSDKGVLTRFNTDSGESFVMGNSFVK